jgi:hypothetical protein
MEKLIPQTLGALWFKRQNNLNWINSGFIRVSSVSIRGKKGF